MSQGIPAGGGKRGAAREAGRPHTCLAEDAWRYWILQVPPILSLAVWLTVPLALAEGRPVLRWSRLGASIATGFMGAVLVLGAELIVADKERSRGMPTGDRPERRTRAGGVGRP